MTQHRSRDLVNYLNRLGALDIRAHFTPDMENFFGRLSKQQLQMTLDDMGMPGTITDMKKGEAAKYVADMMQEDWIPEAIRPKEA